MKRKIVAATAALLLAALLAGCNTIHGLGKDIERAGQKTQEAADAVKKKL